MRFAPVDARRASSSAAPRSRRPSTATASAAAPSTSPWAQLAGPADRRRQAPNWRADLASPLRSPGSSVSSMQPAGRLLLHRLARRPAQRRRLSRDQRHRRRPARAVLARPAAGCGRRPVQRRPALFGRARRCSPATTPSRPRVPYLGIGYTGLATRGGWSFSADLGLIVAEARQRGRASAASYGTQSLDDAVRDLRLSPVLQVGVSYSF